MTGVVIVLAVMVVMQALALAMLRTLIRDRDQGAW